MKLLFLTPMIICLPLLSMDNEQASYVIKNKSELEKAIKSDIYAIVVQEMGFMRDWGTLSAGNEELRKDLEDISLHLHGSQSQAQNKLNAFCARWKMNPIKIEDCFAENEV